MWIILLLAFLGIFINSIIVAERTGEILKDLKKIKQALDIQEEKEPTNRFYTQEILDKFEEENNK